MDGGYDDGYKNCPCFWGKRPGSLISQLIGIVPDFNNLRILDVGCGEGKNSVYLASFGAKVRSVDVSDLAITNARLAWGTVPNISWEIGDVRSIDLPPNTFDVIIAYGLLHCMPSREVITSVVSRLKLSTKRKGIHVVCAFNNRSQDLTAHPSFRPCLLTHSEYEVLYSDWKILSSTDMNLTEVHPHNGIEHTHSMTRMLVRSPE